MRYRLRTLMIATAIEPPFLAIASLVSERYPAVAVLIVVWSVAFVVSLAQWPRAKSRLGLTVVEWLAIVGIVTCLVALTPEWQPARE